MDDDGWSLLPAPAPQDEEAKARGERVRVVTFATIMVGGGKETRDARSALYHGQFPKAATVSFCLFVYYFASCWTH